MIDKQRAWRYYVLPIAVVAALGAALYWARTQRTAPQPVAEAPIEQPSAKPPIKHPIGEAAAPEQPLPPLAQSDPVLQESLFEVFSPALEQFLVPTDIVRNVVVTIDNLPRKKAPVQRRPLKAAQGTFAVSGAEELTLSEANYVRYAPVVKLAQTAEVAQIAAAYRRFYPLFQEAYVGLGYPDGYFNDRLVEVIDHLLETPDVQGPIRLTQPGVFYEFADPTLEERSAGQKLLIRMGPQNAAVIKTKLRELRSAIAR